jgi:hypothetical protein
MTSIYYYHHFYSGKQYEKKKFHTLENMRFSNYYATNRLARTSRTRLAQLLRAIYAASYNKTLYVDTTRIL